MKTLNKKAADKSSSGHTKSTADKSNEEKEENKSDGDTDEEDNTIRQHANLTEQQKQLNPIDEVDEEEDKVEMPETPSNRAATSTSLIKKSSLSTKSYRMFKPSILKSKDKGFEVDEKGLLKITGFDDSLNIKFTNHLAEFYKKTSVRFKFSPKMDTTAYLKT